MDEDDIGLGRVLQAIHSYEYEAESKDGTKRQIQMARGDKYILLRTANEEWWDVIHYEYQTKPDKRFYVPAKYVKALPPYISIEDCDHEDFKRRLEKNNRRLQKQTRRSGPAQSHQVAGSRLSTFDDGTLLDVNNRWPDESDYKPGVGVSTIMRNKMRRGSDPDTSHVVGQLVKENIGTSTCINAESEKRITPVPPPVLDRPREINTPEPNSEDEKKISPRPVRKRTDGIGMSMTQQAVNRVNNMPEPVKPPHIRRSNERSSPVPMPSEPSHGRFSSLGSQSEYTSLVLPSKNRNLSEGDNNVFSTSAPASNDWSCEVDADTGNRYWFASFTPSRWRECYDAQTNNHYYWNEDNNEVIWSLPEKPEDQIQSPKTPNLTSKRGTILYNKHAPGKQTSKMLSGWGEIHGNSLNIYKTAPKQIGGGTIYAVEPEIRIDFYNSKIRTPSQGFKTKKNEEAIKYFDILSPHLKYETVIKDDNCWLTEVSQKHKTVNGKSRWSTRKSVRNMDLAKFEKALGAPNVKRAEPRALTLPANHKSGSDKKKKLEDTGWTLNSLFKSRGTGHRKELERKGIIKNNYFGSSIQEIIKNEKSKVPEFITWCIEHIERDITQDGIYRVAANQATVHALRLDVDRGIERSKWKYGQEVHVVCGALKLFFRELPDALINPKTETQYKQWTELPNFDSATLYKQVKVLLKNSIDEALKPTLKALFDHFQKVLSHAAQNRMAAQNIAIVFGPTLIQAPGSSVPSYESTMIHNNVVHTLIEHYDELKGLFA